MSKMEIQPYYPQKTVSAFEFSTFLAMSIVVTFQNLLKLTAINIFNSHESI